MTDYRDEEGVTDRIADAQMPISDEDAMATIKRLNEQYEVWEREVIAADKVFHDGQ